MNRPPLLLVFPALVLALAAPGPAPAAEPANEPSLEERIGLLESEVVGLRRQRYNPTSISGYMDFHYNDFKPGSSQLDFHRFVLLVGHEFSDSIRFYSELEVEHAFIRGGTTAAPPGNGEVELEQAFVDFHINPRLALRTGVVLVPMGIQNERHEGPAYYGVERHQVESVIIPSTWFEPGIGAFGRIPLGDLAPGGIDYKVYLLGSLDATQFRSSGIRNGRTKGFFSNAEEPAVAGRLAYSGIPDLDLGTSFYYGDAGYNVASTTTNKVSVLMYDFDAQYRWKRLDLRGLWARTHIGRTGELNRVVTAANQPVAERLEGYSLEAGLHLLPETHKWDLAVFGRYEVADTQKRVARGFTRAAQFDRNWITTGVSFWPHPDVVVKADYQFGENEHPTIVETDSFNLGLGWWF